MGIGKGRQRFWARGSRQGGIQGVYGSMAGR